MEGDGYYTNLMNETEENNDVSFASRSPPQCSKHPVWAILAARGQTRRDQKILVRKKINY